MNATARNIKNQMTASALKNKAVLECRVQIVSGSAVLSLRSTDRALAAQLGNHSKSLTSSKVTALGQR